MDLLNTKGIQNRKSGFVTFQIRNHEKNPHLYKPLTRSLNSVNTYLATDVNVNLHLHMYSQKCLLVKKLEYVYWRFSKKKLNNIRKGAPYTDDKLNVIL
jgi:hypothetical protein